MLLILVICLNDFVKFLGDILVKLCIFLFDVWKDIFVLGVDLFYNYKLIILIGKIVKISKFLIF